MTRSAPSNRIAEEATAGLAAPKRRGRVSAGRIAASVRARAGKYLLRVVVIGYLVMLVAWPLVLVVQRAFGDGLGDIQAILSDPDVVHALKLTVVVAAIAVAVNTVFGIAMSLILVRTNFRGKRVLSALVDLPLAVSPVVVGLALTLTYGGRNGWLGPYLESHGLQVIFSTPGIVLATVFVSLPLMVREVVPVLTEMGMDQERAAYTLGANRLQTFIRITLPTIRWGVAYGFVLSLARSLGEFGAVKVVSGNVLGSTRTATLVVEEKYLNFDRGGAYATSFLLTMMSVACIVVISIIRPREQRDR